MVLGDSAVRGAQITPISVPVNSITVGANTVVVSVAVPQPLLVYSFSIRNAPHGWHSVDTVHSLREELVYQPLLNGCNGTDEVEEDAQDVLIGDFVGVVSSELKIHIVTQSANTSERRTSVGAEPQTGGRPVQPHGDSTSDLESSTSDSACAIELEAAGIGSWKPDASLQEEMNDDMNISVQLKCYELDSSPPASQVVPLLNLATLLESHSFWMDAVEAYQLCGLALANSRRFIQSSEMFRKAQQALIHSLGDGVGRDKLMYLCSVLNVLPMMPLDHRREIYIRTVQDHLAELSTDLMDESQDRDLLCATYSRCAMLDLLAAEVLNQHGHDVQCVVAYYRSTVFFHNGKLEAGGNVSVHSDVTSNLLTLQEGIVPLCLKALEASLQALRLASTSALTFILDHNGCSIAQHFSDIVLTLIRSLVPRLHNGHAMQRNPEHLRLLATCCNLVPFFNPVVIYDVLQRCLLPIISDVSGFVSRAAMEEAASTSHFPFSEEVFEAISVDVTSHVYRLISFIMIRLQVDFPLTFPLVNSILASLNSSNVYVRVAALKLWSYIRKYRLVLRLLCPSHKNSNSGTGTSDAEPPVKSLVQWMQTEINATAVRDSDGSSTSLRLGPVLLLLRDIFSVWSTHVSRLNGVGIHELVLLAPMLVSLLEEVSTQHSIKCHHLVVNEFAGECHMSNRPGSSGGGASNHHSTRPPSATSGRTRPAADGGSKFDPSQLYSQYAAGKCGPFMSTDQGSHAGFLRSGCFVFLWDTVEKYSAVIPPPYQLNLHRVFSPILHNVFECSRTSAPPPDVMRILLRMLQNVSCDQVLTQVLLEYLDLLCQWVPSNLNDEIFHLVIRLLDVTGGFWERCHVETVIAALVDRYTVKTATYRRAINSFLSRVMETCSQLDTRIDDLYFNDGITDEGNATRIVGLPSDRRILVPAKMIDVPSILYLDTLLWTCFYNGNKSSLSPNISVEAFTTFHSGSVPDVDQFPIDHFDENVHQMFCEKVGLVSQAMLHLNESHVPYILQVFPSIVDRGCELIRLADLKLRTDVLSLITRCAERCCRYLVHHVSLAAPAGEVAVDPSTVTVISLAIGKFLLTLSRICQDHKDSDTLMTLLRWSMEWLDLLSCQPDDQHTGENCIPVNGVVHADSLLGIMLHQRSSQMLVFEQLIEVWRVVTGLLRTGWKALRHVSLVLGYKWTVVVLSFISQIEFPSNAAVHTHSGKTFVDVLRDFHNNFIAVVDRQMRSPDWHGRFMGLCTVLLYVQMDPFCRAASPEKKKKMWAVPGRVVNTMADWKPTLPDRILRRVLLLCRDWNDVVAESAAHACTVMKPLFEDRGIKPIGEVAAADAPFVEAEQASPFVLLGAERRNAEQLVQQLHQDGEELAAAYCATESESSLTGAATQPVFRILGVVKATSDIESGREVKFAEKSAVESEADSPSALLQGVDVGINWSMGRADRELPSVPQKLWEEQYMTSDDQESMEDFVRTDLIGSRGRPESRGRPLSAGGSSSAEDDIDVDDLGIIDLDADEMLDELDAYEQLLMRGGIGLGGSRARSPGTRRLMLHLARNVEDMGLEGETEDGVSPRDAVEPSSGAGDRYAEASISPRSLEGDQHVVYLYEDGRERMIIQPGEAELRALQERSRRFRERALQTDDDTEGSMEAQIPAGYGHEPVALQIRRAVYDRGEMNQQRPYRPYERPSLNRYHFVRRNDRQFRSRGSEPHGRANGHTQKFGRGAYGSPPLADDGFDRSSVLTDEDEDESIEVVDVSYISSDEEDGTSIPGRRGAPGTRDAEDGGPGHHSVEKHADLLADPDLVPLLEHPRSTRSSRRSSLPVHQDDIGTIISDCDDEADNVEYLFKEDEDGTLSTSEAESGGERADDEVDDEVIDVDADIEGDESDGSDHSEPAADEGESAAILDDHNDHFQHDFQNVDVDRNTSMDNSGGLPSSPDPLYRVEASTTEAVILRMSPPYVRSPHQETTDEALVRGSPFEDDGGALHLSAIDSDHHTPSTGRSSLAGTPVPGSEERVSRSTDQFSPVPLRRRKDREPHILNSLESSTVASPSASSVDLVNVSRGMSVSGSEYVDGAAVFSRSMPVSVERHLREQSSSPPLSMSSSSVGKRLNYRVPHSVGASPAAFGMSSPASQMATPSPARSFLKNELLYPTS